MTHPDTPTGSDLYAFAMGHWCALTHYDQTQIKAIATAYLQRWRPLRRPHKIFQDFLDTLGGRVLAESHQSVVSAHPRPLQGDDAADRRLDLWLTINAELYDDLWPIVGPLITLMEPPRQEHPDPTPGAHAP